MDKIQIPVVCRLGSWENPCDLVGNGGRTRKPKTSGGKRLPDMRARRYFCKQHRQSLTLPPEPLLPRIHYEALVVTRCVEDRIYPRRFPRETAYWPHRRTVGRWVKKLAGALDRVREKTGRVLGKNWAVILEDLRYAVVGKLQRLWELLEILAHEAKENRPAYFYVMARSP